MEALSVAASIAGLISFGAQLLPIVQNLASVLDDAPQDAYAALAEVKIITMILTQLQMYIDRTLQPSIQRLSLIHIEHVTVTLTECVVTYSQLNSTLKDLRVDKGLKGWDRALWLLKKDDVGVLVSRLQNHKSSIALMLQIIQCTTTAEAEQSTTRLCDLVSKVLDSNQELVARLRIGEGTISNGTSSRFDLPDESDPAAFNDVRASAHTVTDTNTNPTSHPSITCDGEASTPSNWPFISHDWQPGLRAFEEQLYRTRVYRHASDGHSQSSVLDDGRSTIVRSLNSSLTLGEISNISVYELSIFAKELSNAEYYEWQQRTPSTTARVWKPFIDPNKPKRPSRRLRRKAQQTVFGVPIEISVHYAGISPCAVDPHWSFQPEVCVPLVIAKCAAHLKSSEQIGDHVFDRKECNEEKVNELVTIFSTYPDFGRTMTWERYTVYDWVHLLLRYLRSVFGTLPLDPIIPYEFFHRFTNPWRSNMTHQMFQKVYTPLIAELPPVRRQLLLYVLDLLDFIASKSRNNIKGKADGRLARIFQHYILPGTLDLGTLSDAVPNASVIKFLLQNQEILRRNVHALTTTHATLGKETPVDMDDSGSVETIDAFNDASADIHAHNDSA